LGPPGPAGQGDGADGGDGGDGHERSNEQQAASCSHDDEADHANAGGPG